MNFPDLEFAVDVGFIGLRDSRNDYFPSRAQPREQVFHANPRTGEFMLGIGNSPSRRHNSRVVATGDVWVYWEGHPHRDVSHVRDLSASGLFVETRMRKAKGESLKLHFLVQEGTIRVEAVVRHAAAGSGGLGLKLKSVTPQDIPQFNALLSRIRSTPITSSRY